VTAAPTTDENSTSGASSNDVADAHAEMLSDRNLQFDMQPLTYPEPPAWLEPVLAIFNAIAPLLTYVFWGGIILVAGFVLYIILTDLARRLPGRALTDAEASAPKPVYRPSTARAHALLEEADKLAAQGRYNEAVRVLLHRSIEDIERFFTVAIGPGLTSREIARLEPLSNEGRTVFSAIAQAVEKSLFGGRTLTNDDFAQARAGYASFAKVGR
jgi:hypothetical protein